MAPVHVAPVHGLYGFWTSTGTILVLYILLVIILRSTFH
ncbi:MAG: sporulation protein YjcZ [Paenibacillus macerans]|nr:sporulation protein YjcZ [Paenibacillus macerans]MBS5909274.1 sporulation protein YjcZ [Paenibacillus macerans]MCY7556942.1 sporulation protein YjcZ [Paenibacillus macerans]MDU5946693.1 sporulation protein YjcZ [Paenibacillus macerans]MDU7476397.1 sporulation protein YjcZ [Paenibacillus macerans]MEC0139161.1 sporulation protein YjcZ [Paenibacillus macerans]